MLADTYREISRENIVPAYVYSEMKSSAISGRLSCTINLRMRGDAYRADDIIKVLRKEGFSATKVKDAFLIVSWEEE